MQKLFIRNRKNQNMAVVVEETPNAKGMAFVMHGLGGDKYQPHIQVFVAAFKEHGLSVVYFDTTNTFGESDGDYADATLTNYYEDLEDVINWSKTQRWYAEPFWLCGHSLGGISVALYAEKYPTQVKALAPISTVISGKLSLETPRYKKNLEVWQKTGWRIEENAEVPGRIKKLKWSHVEDRLHYDLLPQVNKLTMPVLLIAGELDNSTPPVHQKMLFDALPGPKEFHVVAGAPHTFRALQHLAEIKKIMSEWIGKYLEDNVIYVFIDASNLWAAQKAKGKFFDYEKLRKFIKEEFNGVAIEVFYYTAYPADGTREYSLEGKHKFYTFLKKGLGFKVRKKELKRIITASAEGQSVEEKGNMDVEIAIDAVHHSKKYTIAVLFSGDSDFLALVTYLRNGGKKVYIFSSKNNISEELKTGGDGYYDILNVQEDIWGRELRYRDQGGENKTTLREEGCPKM
ncbi:MAG: alpha/beta fold hydrolase [Patescibacteria group bacterium]|jgi:hypothetical protein